MSKLFKRTLTLALVLCMLLTVMAPMASAATTTTQTFDFARKSSTYTNVNQVATAADSKSGNWYYLSSSASESMSFDQNNGIVPVTDYYNPSTATYHYLALALDVTVEGQYDLLMQYRRNNYGSPKVGFTIFKAADNTVVSAIKNASASLIKQYITDENTVMVNYTYGSGVGVWPYAYLGCYDLTPGTYILIIRPLEKRSATSSYARWTLSSITASPKAEDITSSGACYYQIAGNMNISGTFTAKAGVVTYINAGKNMTAKNVVAGASSSQNGWLRGDGTLTLTGGNLSLKADNPDMPLNVSGNTYKFAKVEAAFCEAPAVRDGAQTGTKSFGFSVSTIADAYGWDLANLNVKLDVVVAGEEQGAECIYSSDMINEWKVGKAASDDVAFYVDIANYDLLAGKTLNFRVEVSCGGAAVVLTPTYTVPAA